MVKDRIFFIVYNYVFSDAKLRNFPETAKKNLYQIK